MKPHTHHPTNREEKEKESKRVWDRREEENKREAYISNTLRMCYHGCHKETLLAERNFSPFSPLSSKSVTVHHTEIYLFVLWGYFYVYMWLVALFNISIPFVGLLVCLLEHICYLWALSILLLWGLQKISVFLCQSGFLLLACHMQVYDDEWRFFPV